MLSLELAADGIIILLLVWLLVRVRMLHIAMVKPLPQAVTMRGVVPLALKDRGDYFKSQRDTFSKRDPRWKLYDEALKRVSA